jgi:hypothetical protein
VLPFNCSSVWLAPLPAKWGNSVLNAALCPRGQLHNLPPALLWEVGLSPHPCSQTLYFSHTLLGASGSSGRLACHPTPTLILCCCSWVSLRVWLLAPPLISGEGSAFHPYLHCQCYITIRCLCFSVLLGRGSIPSAQGLCWIMFPWGG